MKRLLALAALLLLLAETAGSELVAERITAANFATHHVGGPDSDAGIDDWFLSNGTLCAAVSDPSHESPLAPRGGVLIDLGHCGRDDDQWAVMQPMLNLAQSQVVQIDRVESATTEELAWIETRGVFAGVEIRTRFMVSADEERALEIETRARRIGPGEALFALGQIVLHASGQVRPYSLLLSRPEASLGFHYPETDHDSVLSLLGALHRSDLTVLVGQEALAPISYGIESLPAFLSSPETGRTSPPETLRPFTVVGEHFTSTNLLASPPWLGDDASSPSLLDLARIPWMDLEPGATIVSRSRIWISHQADVASVTDRFLSDAPLISGRIDEPGARIEISRQDGTAANFVRPDGSGRFSLRIRPGSYRLVASAAAGRRTEVGFEVALEERNQVIPPISLGAPARVRPPPGWTGRLVFLDTETDQPLSFRQSNVEFRVGDVVFPNGLEAPFINIAARPAPSPERDELRSFEVPPGRYRVLATRGPEYSIAETRLQVVAGHVTDLEIEPLVRTVASPGWIAADLHVHTGASFDSDLPAERQMEAFAASGAEVLVATEHDRIADPAPMLERAGLSGAFATIMGVEMTSAFEGNDSPHATGHWNAFPVARDPMAYRGGAPNLEGRRARDAIAEFRKGEPDAFLQLNHPRPGLQRGEGDTYFSHLGVAGVPFEPSRSLEEPPNRVLIEVGPTHPGRDLDYDGVELLNGPDLLPYRRNRADWYSLLLQGERHVGVASSDSHRLGKIVGLPRTYVSSSSESVASFSQSEFIQSLHRGRAYGSTGPLLRVELGAAGMGDLHAGTTGILEVELQSASWIATTFEWRAFVNGELVHRAPIQAGPPARLPLVFPTDAFVTVEIEGIPTSDYALRFPGFTPFAFSNPIFVDADGDGLYSASGLPRPVPKTLLDPDAPD